ncbi:MAG: tRNA-intron lyase [Nitrosopumilus sp.]|nr:tRNA-intron lyase [Nitrosopumilus sp.]CAI9831415.1 tRNA-splicing endonuclease [Nitrosopumilaceae archaeon]MDA7944214.1 tRNA-intron lyase [Nitrosopumilus sp.]MDA7952308.1 tRNA-intron lyase [Nitrosopumilus sp.]MDA7953966.1 tRNA-intron lyase [Nitrosopumilus sp.]
MPAADLVGGRFVVWDRAAGGRIFRSGYYGKPVGVPKPKADGGDVPLGAPLVLDAMEALYLSRKGVITVRSGGRRLGDAEIEEACRASHHGFAPRYAVYEDFRERGYVVGPGIKFGCDFAVYERGPGIDHAPYLVRVCTRSEPLTATGLVHAGRMATTVRKQFIFAIPGSGGVEYLAIDWWRA